MRLGPLIHGGLLVVALLFAYQTSTRSKSEKPTKGTHSVWKESAIASLVFESEKSTVRLEWREDDHGKYLWGVEKRSRVVKTPVKKTEEPAKPGEEAKPADAAKPGEEAKPADAAKPAEEAKPADAAKPAEEAKAGEEAKPADAAKPAEEAKPEMVEETIVTTREFPVGKAGRELLEEYENLMALRKIGPVATDELERYELHENTLTLTIVFGKDQQRTLLLAGNTIYGGSDRNALDVDSNIAYVLSGKLLKPLESAENSLGLETVHTYKDELVKSVEVKTTTGDKEILKGSTVDEKGEHTTWSDVASPGQNDTTLGTFIERVGKLKPVQYDPEINASELVHIATLRYRDSKKQALGYLELYRQLPAMQEPSEDSKRPNETQYYIKTEETRVLGKVGRLGGQQIDQDLVELFGITPPPPDPQREEEPPAEPTPAGHMGMPVLPPMGGHAH